MHEPQPGDIRLDDVDFLQRRDDQQLQVHAAKQFQSIARRLIRAAAERFVDDNEAERP